MQKSHKAPYIFLFFLLIIVVFVVGMKYGRKVETADKVISLILSITPTPSKRPSPTKPLTYSQYIQKGCGLQFLHPDVISVQEESSNAAILSSKDSTQIVEINCDKNSRLVGVIKDPKIATKEVTFKTQKIKARESSQDTLTFELRNARNGKTIYVSIDKNLYPLFENTLQYLP